MLISNDRCWDACCDLFCVFGNIYVSKTQDAEVTKSLGQSSPILLYELFFCFHVKKGKSVCTMAFIGHSPHNNKKGIGTEMSPAIVSGFLFGEEPVSYWPIFSPIPCNRPRSLCESKFGAVPSCFLRGEFAEFFCAKTS